MHMGEAKNKQNAPTCGNCSHGVIGVGPDQKLDFNIRVCFRLPPVPVVMIQTLPDGFVQSSLQMSRPVMQRTTRACGEHKPGLGAEAEGAGVEGAA